MMATSSCRASSVSPLPTTASAVTPSVPVAASQTPASRTNLRPGPAASSSRASLYSGEVVHVRLRPKPHRLAYRVTTLAIDVDLIAAVANQVAGFAYNRTAVMSLHDKDYGDGCSSLAQYPRMLLAAADLSAFAAQITLVTYPRLLGYAFNPVSVFYCRNESGDLGALIYEVNNTFGERKSYVLPAGARAESGGFRQSCDKELSVSPFTPGKGGYRFHVIEPEDRLVIGIQYHDTDGPLLRTHFAGCQFNLTSTSIVGQVLLRPWRSAKVIAAIHLEAARLFLKGVPLIRRHRSPPFSASFPSVSGKRRVGEIVGD